MKKIIAFLIVIVLVLPELLFSQSVGGLYYARLGSPLNIYGTVSTKKMIFEYADSYFTIGTNSGSYPIRFFPEGTTSYVMEIQDDEIVIPSGKTLTVGGTLATTGAITQTGGVAGLDFIGAYTNAAIDLSNVTLNHTGSAGPVMIRAGTYGSPVTSSDAGQSGMIRLYGRNSALTDDEASGFYDRGLFVSLKTTGAKGIFPIAGLAEVEATVSGNGPTAVMAAQFIAHLLETGSKLANTTGVNGMYGGWFKITAIDGATTGATSKKAAVWLDNQMYGNNAAPGEEYTLFNTTGGLKPDAWAGFETTSAGWSNLFYFDETAYDQDPVVSGDLATGGSRDYYLKVSINGTIYGIQLFAQ